jgi:hypothetical protein
MFEILHKCKGQCAKCNQEKAKIRNIWKWSLNQVLLCADDTVTEKLSWRKWQEAREDWIMTSFITCTLHHILLG